MDFCACTFCNCAVEVLPFSIYFQRRGWSSDCDAIHIIIGSCLLLSSVKGEERLWFHKMVNSHVLQCQSSTFECIMTVELFIDYCIVVMIAKRLFAAWAV